MAGGCCRHAAASPRCPRPRRSWRRRPPSLIFFPKLPRCPKLISILKLS
jgi:hypothetical protein